MTAPTEAPAMCGAHPIRLDDNGNCPTCDAVCFWCEQPLRTDGTCPNCDHNHTTETLR